MTAHLVAIESDLLPSSLAIRLDYFFPMPFSRTLLSLPFPCGP